MDVPWWLFGILLLIGFAVFLIKGIGFTKDIIEWFLSGVIAFLGIALLIQFQFPNVFEGLTGFGQFMAFSGIQLGAGVPATILLRYLLKPLFWILRWVGILGKK